MQKCQMTPGDCAPHAARARELLEALGLAVEAHAVPAQLVQAAGMVSATNLIVRHRFGAGPVVALNAHGDVVPPGLGWRHDPYGAAIETGPYGPAMYGRGVAVSKIGLCAYAFALLALRAAESRREAR
jgi:acetylornithine deacetylase/succinyl-diaminopimelate desuccinylase-like protein